MKKINRVLAVLVMGLMLFFPQPSRCLNSSSTGLDTFLDRASKVTTILLIGLAAYRLIKMINPLSIQSQLQGVSLRDIPQDCLEVINQKLASTMSSYDVYLGMIKKMPWKHTRVPEFDASQIKSVLDKAQYGREDVKEQIQTYMLRSFAPNLDGTSLDDITPRPLCLVGDAGTGKTSLANALAEALGRKSYSIGLLGGSLSEGVTLLKGSASVYQGAMPGELANALCRTESSCPVIVIDKIDQVSSNTITALVEALDHKSNKRFIDNFLGFGIDLSHVFFVATATDISSVPSSLRDLFDVIYLDSYSDDQKLEIAQRVIIPDLLRKYALPPLLEKNLLDVAPHLIELVSKTDHGSLRPLVKAFEALVLKQLRAFMDSGEFFELTADNLSTHLDSSFTKLRLGLPRSPRLYCNNIIKNLPLSQDQFRAIETKVLSLIDRNSVNYLNTYLEWISRYPFQKVTQALLPSLKSAQEQLDVTHVGMNRVKENILDYLAGLIKASDTLPKILCLSGGAGLGKTTIAHSIAKALARPMSVISLDGADYIGATDSAPGKLAQALCDAQSLNPVILLDEIDKASPGLLIKLIEILDMSRNHKVRDEYLGFDVDLSQVTFMITANYLDKVPYPLLDRMFIIELDPYTKAERIAIACQKMLPKIYASISLSEQSHNVIQGIVEPLVGYTMNAEYGVRLLQKLLQVAAEKCARAELEAVESGRSFEGMPDNFAEIVVAACSPDLLSDLPELTVEKEDKVGIVNGLYARGTNGGGINKLIMKLIPYGNGKLRLSELYKKTTQESLSRALSYVKSVARDYNINESLFSTHDFEVGDQTYYTSDGPSGGVAEIVGLISVLTNRKIRSEYAITGAIDLYGNVLPVAGYRAKIAGAMRSGVKKFILPESSRKVIKHYEQELEGAEFFFVNHVDQALKLVLH